MSFRVFSLRSCKSLLLYPPPSDVLTSPNIFVADIFAFLYSNHLRIGSHTVLASNDLLSPSSKRESLMVRNSDLVLAEQG